MNGNKYIWLNPVVLNLYDKKELNTELNKKGYQIVRCEENHIDIVKQKYSDIIGKNCVLDVRCPKAIQYVKSHYDTQQVLIPEIHPILIHCALELNKRFINVNNNNSLTIITPCTDLAHSGNNLNLKNTVFVTWNEFEKVNQICLHKKNISESPIPPGFFNGYGNDSISLKSKNEIDTFFQSKGYQCKKVVEMLYCCNGCHNGDGV